MLPILLPTARTSVTPASLLGPDGMWLSASRSVNLDGVTGNVETWVDQMPNPVTFSQLTDANQPILNVGPPANIQTGTAGTGFLSAPSAAKHRPSTQFYWAAWLQRLSSLDRNYWSQWDAVDEILIVGNTGGGVSLTITLAETPAVLATLDFALFANTTDIFVEMAYDGSLAVADRCQVFYDRVRQVSTGGTGTVPASLNPGVTPTTFIAAFQGVARMPARFYNMYTDLLIPTDTVRNQLFAFEAP